jgi:formylglycine-generating enzyme required for sulfatase activity
VALVVISGVALVALDQADRAEQGETAARRNADEARQNAQTAEQKANDVLSLSAQKEYDDLVAQAEQLWPASTEMIPRYEEWLSKARALVDGRPADESKGLKKRPSLAEHKAKLAELREDALPLTEEQIRADRETHPQFAEWQTKSADLLWHSRMLGMVPWPDSDAAEAEPTSEQLPGDANGLNEMAWKLVDPKQPVFGQEVRALLLAQRAVALAADEKSAAIRDTLAWALYRNGKLDAALAEIKIALSDPGGEELEQSAIELEKSVMQWKGEEVAKRRQDRETLVTEVAALSTRVNERRTYGYASDEKAWWDRQLRVLVGNIESFADPKSGLLGSGVNPEIVWGVQKRYDFAKTVRERTITGAEAKRRWDEAILAIAKSEQYRHTVFPGGGLLTPQEGLLPLGADPQSGLWEFWHVQSGDEPERDKDGDFKRQKSGAHKLVEKGENGTGIVLVLIPGGTFWMGAQKTDPNGQNYDPNALKDETVHKVILSPYFLSKYEMTQGQWSRFTGLNPSLYKAGFNGTVGITNPVEQVDWLACEKVTRLLGLEIPSEAQWEFACRAGTSSVWWTGNAKESLADKVNLADQSYADAEGSVENTVWWAEFKDGFAVHAPAGRFAANAFGLHEVCGNVFEWCFDADTKYPTEATSDPRTNGDGLAPRVFRGGCFSDNAMVARSAFRIHYVPTFQIVKLGVRPSRALRLSTSPLHNGR